MLLRKQSLFILKYRMRIYNRPILPHTPKFFSSVLEDLHKWPIWSKNRKICQKAEDLLHCSYSNCDVLTFAGFLMFNRWGALWPQGLQRGSLGKIHQNGEYLKQAIQKSCPLTGFEPAVLDYRSTALPLELERTQTISILVLFGQVYGFFFFVS